MLKVDGLTPVLIPAELVIPPTYLQCGSCGFNGVVLYVFHVDTPECFEAWCNCPLPACLTA